jgi:hypothetical protein
VLTEKEFDFYAKVYLYLFYFQIYVVFKVNGCCCRLVPNSQSNWEMGFSLPNYYFVNLLINM